MLFQLFAPQGLECAAAAVQRVGFSEIRKFAHQVTKNNFTGGHTRVFRHNIYSEFGNGMLRFKYFSPGAENAERSIFAFVGERPTNANPQALRAIIPDIRGLRGLIGVKFTILPEGLLFFTFWPLTRK